MRVRAVPAVDQLDRDGERLVLLPERAVRVAGLAPLLLDLATDWRTPAELAQAVTERHGAPPDGNPEELVQVAVVELVAAGLLEVESL